MADIITALQALVDKFSRQRDDNLTRREFLEREHISPSSLKKLEKRGLGPRFKRLPGLALERLTKEEYEAWRRRMDELAAEEAETPEQKAKERRWLEQRRDAGRRGGRPKKNNKHGGALSRGPR